VELGMGTKHVVKGYGTMPFWMESIGVLRVTDMLWVPKLKISMLSFLVIEKKEFDIAFQDGKELIMPRGYSLEKVSIFGVRER